MILTKLLLARMTGRLYRDPGDGDGTGEKIDRGDDFVPTEDDEPKAAAKPEPKAEKADEKPLPKDKKSALKELAGKDDAEEPEEDEEEPEDEPKAEEKPKKDTRIPLKRHQEMLNKERERREAAENALKGFQGQTAVVKTNEEITKRETAVVDLEKQYAKALTDGEHTQAAELMGKIRKLEREIVTLESESKIAAAESRAIEVARYRVTLERIEEQYPVLNEDHEDFDEDVYKEVVDLANAYRAAGRSPSDALQRAVKKELGASTYAQKQATTVKPRVDKDDVEEDPQAKKRAERTKEGTERTLKAVEKSPATATAKAGLNSNERGAERTAKDVIKMSQSDFAKVDEKELARLRGDILEGAE